MQLRMTHLDVDKHKIAFPGIDGFIEDGEIAIPISLKEVTSPNIKQLGKNIRAIAESANKANATPDFDGILKDITAMITAKRFTKQIIDKIVSVRQQHPMKLKIVKRYFVEGKDGSAWIDFLFNDYSRKMRFSVFFLSLTKK